MKREITCIPCGSWWKAQVTNAASEGESLSITDGRAKAEYRCDGCNTVIAQDDPCCAVSLRSAEQSNFMRGWELDFIRLEPESSGP